MAFLPELGPIVSITIPVPDLGVAEGLYAEWFGFRAIARGNFADAVAKHWNLPGLAGRAWRYLVSSGSASLLGGLRLIDSGPIPPPLPPLTSIGWAAAELSVMNVDKLSVHLQQSPFKIIGYPRALGSNAAIRAMQVAGPYGEVFYLTDVRAYKGPLSLNSATCPVDHTFIVVLAAKDLNTARRFYETRFGIRRVSDDKIVIPVLNDAFGAPTGTLYHISSQQLVGGNLIEIDEYPPTAVMREPLSCGLPPGIAMVTIAKEGAAARFRDVADLIGSCGDTIIGGAGELLESIGPHNI